MAIDRQDFQLTQNTSKQVTFTITNGGSPQDLTNVPLRWRMSTAIDDQTAALEKGNTLPLDGLTVPNPSTGQCVVAIDDDDIDEYGLFFHFLEGNINSGGWKCLSRGRVVVEPAIGAAT